jgi:hypothetical protein
MSRISPENSKAHTEDAHYLMAPADLARHIEEHHYPYPSEIMADWYTPDKVNAFLAERGIPQADEGTEDMEPWEIDGLLAWHEQAHDATGFSGTDPDPDPDTTDPFGPDITAPDPISDGTITLRTDRSLDEMDAILQIRGTDSDGHEMFGPTYFAELTRYEAQFILDRLGFGEDANIIAARLRRLIAHTQEAGR